MQTSYSQDPPIGLVGALADSGLERKVLAMLAEGAVPIGIFAARGTDKGRQAVQPAAPTATGATAILATGFATAATAVTKGAADFNGVAVGAARMPTPRNITATLSSHADFDAGTLVLIGLDAMGVQQEETLFVPDGGNTVLVGKLLFSQLLSARLSAMAGTGGAVTLGIGDDKGAMTGRDIVGIAMCDSGKVSLTDYADKETMSVLRKGRVFVACETTAVAGEPVFMRLIATGGEVRGAIRKDADGSAGNPDAVEIVGARFAKTITSAGVVPIDLDL